MVVWGHVCEARRVGGTIVLSDGPAREAGFGEDRHHRWRPRFTALVVARSPVVAFLVIGGGLTLITDSLEVVFRDHEYLPAIMLPWTNFLNEFARAKQTGIKISLLGGSPRSS